jgi:hypothetical protein
MNQLTRYKIAKRVKGGYFSSKNSDTIIYINATRYLA